VCHGLALEIAIGEGRGLRVDGFAVLKLLASVALGGVVAKGGFAIVGVAFDALERVDEFYFV
jgi:hypothetical protein